MRTKVRDILGAFMFGGEASDKFVKVLSGGERSRLAMIRLLLEPVNFLILDEPTNHLDMQSKDVLKRAVKDFDGTVIVVSHDRDFLDGLVDRVYEFADGKVREHIGGIYDFLEMKRMENEGLTGVGENVNARTEPQKTGGQELLQEKEVKANDGALSYEQQKELAKIKRKAEKRVKDAEQLIEQLEQQIAEIEEKMTTPEGASDVSLFTRHAEIKAKLSEAEDEWEEASIQLEEMG
jgi:ATP-binding cassette subfamily F protein 3